MFLKDDLTKQAMFFVISVSLFQLNIMYHIAEMLRQANVMHHIGPCHKTKE